MLISLGLPKNVFLRKDGRCYRSMMDIWETKYMYLLVKMYQILLIITLNTNEYK